MFVKLGNKYISTLSLPFITHISPLFGGSVLHYPDHKVFVRAKPISVMAAISEHCVLVEEDEFFFDADAFAD